MTDIMTKATKDRRAFWIHIFPIPSSDVLESNRYTTRAAAEDAAKKTSLKLNGTPIEVRAVVWEATIINHPNKPVHYFGAMKSIVPTNTED